MRKPKQVVVACSLIGTMTLVAVGCGEGDTARRDAPQPEGPPEIALETVAQDLVIPWAIACTSRRETPPDPSSPRMRPRWPGKLLRYRPDGTVPDDNPRPESPEYVLGLRNPQGLTWHPETGDPFVTEHGPSELSWETGFGGWFGDELNAIAPGANYGWPRVVGMGPLGRFIDPLVEWTDG